MNYIKRYNEFLFEFQNQEVFSRVLESLNSARNLFLKTQKIPETIFNQLVNADPTPQKKYLEKLCKFYLEHPNLDELKELIEIFDMLVSKRQINYPDINQFKSFDEFQNLVLQNKDKKSKTQIEKEIKISDTEIILNSDDFLIVSPLSHKASCIYGAGTKWCTTEKDSKYWDDYTAQFVKFYYILNKNLPESNKNYKIAVAVYPTGEKECYNALDKLIAFKQVLKLGLSNDLFKSDNITLEKLFNNWIKGTYEIINGIYNVQGDVKVQHLDKLNLTELPIKFGHVSGNFDCSNNKLTSLKNCPKKIGNTFLCAFNDVRSLKYCPQEIGNDFNCSNNELISLKYCPKKIRGNFDCSGILLTSLKDCPEEIGGSFDCSYNKLTSLEYCPEKIGNTFDCSHNKLISLKCCPKEISKNFNCSQNELISLKGCPEKIKGDFSCSYNKLISLKGCPKEVKGKFYCYGNNIKFTSDQVLQLCNVEEVNILK